MLRRFRPCSSSPSGGHWWTSVPIPASAFESPPPWTVGLCFRPFSPLTTRGISGTHCHALQCVPEIPRVVSGEKGRKHNPTVQGGGDSKADAGIGTDVHQCPPDGEELHGRNRRNIPDDTYRDVRSANDLRRSNAHALQSRPKSGRNSDLVSHCISHNHYFA